MNTVGGIEEAALLSESQRTALLTLLTDEDVSVYSAVRKKILACGPAAKDWLRPYTISSDPALRRRTHEIILHFERQAADNVFLAFCLKHGEDLDLEEGAWLLARTVFPEINLDGYRAILDSFAGELRERIDPAAPARTILTIVNQYLFNELQFSGNEADYYDPDNSYLNRVLDRRTGNPINLCLFYMLLGRRLRLPIAGIGLPGHFICRFQSSSAEVYLDVFHRGKLLTKGDCVHYLLNGSFSVKDEYLSPVTSRRLMLRICANLYQIYLMREKEEEATRLQRYVVALGR
jgi:regulator of sirC expression with transglutaminase-like and TPR domain